MSDHPRLPKDGTDSEPKISVIVPVYNGEKYVDRCLECLLGQTLADLEIILINNASRDNSPALIDHYAASHPGRVRSFTFNQNRRPAGARNQGIKLARGEYLAFVDVDDTLEPDMFELLYNRARQTDADLVISSYYETSFLGSKTSTVIRGRLPESSPFLVPYLENIRTDPNILWLAPSCIWNRITKRSLFLNNIIRYPMLHSEDIYVSLITFLHARRISYLNIPLYHYHVIPTSAMFQKNAPYGEEYNLLSKKTLREYEKTGQLNGVTIFILFTKLWHGTFFRRIKEFQYSRDNKGNRKLVDCYLRLLPTFSPDWKNWVKRTSREIPLDSLWTWLLTRKLPVYLYISFPAFLKSWLGGIRGYLLSLRPLFKSLRLRWNTPAGKGARKFARSLKNPINPEVTAICVGQLPPQEFRWPFHKLERFLQPLIRDGKGKLYLLAKREFLVSEQEEGKTHPAKYVELHSGCGVKLLARAKYIIHDGWLPEFYRKKPGQLVIRLDAGGGSLDYRQKKTPWDLKFAAANLLAADLLVTLGEPNRHYLEARTPLPFSGKGISTSLPLRRLLRRRDKADFGWGGRRIIGFAPAWRQDMIPPFFIRVYEEEFEALIASIQGQMGKLDLLVPFLPIPLWPSLLGRRDLPQVQLGREPMDLPTYLSLCDCLISDYSPALEYFAETGKPLVSFSFTLRKSRLPPPPRFDSRPEFPLASTLEELGCFLRHPRPFREEPGYAKYLARRRSTGQGIAALIREGLRLTPAEEPPLFAGKGYDVMVMPYLTEDRPRFADLVAKAGADAIFVILPDNLDQRTRDYIGKHGELRFVTAPELFPATSAGLIGRYVNNRVARIAVFAKEYVKEYLRWLLPGVPVRSFIDYTGKIAPRGKRIG
jgi:glycosyltransferase involved in cell wall biosynthesis